jgi:diguanylate cyclase (GGDEF)-like protein/PAS domain S-box-containing protein
MKLPDLRRLDGYLPPDLEKAYRQFYLKADFRAFAVSLAFFCLLVLAFVYSDFVLFGLSSNFYLLATLRAAYLAYFIALMVFLSKNRSPERFDWSILISLMAGFALLVTINLSRPANNLGTFVVDIIILFMVYLGLPTKLWIRGGSALIFTLTELVTFIFFRQAAPIANLYTLIVVLVMSNLIGLVSSSRLHAFRRSEFKAMAEREQAEQNLRKSNELLTETGRMAKVGGWEYEIGSPYQKWTEEVYRIHELDPSHHPTLEEGLNYYTPEAVPIISAAGERTIELGEPFDLELPFVTAKGNRRWVHAIGRGYFKDGKVVKIGGTFQDITDRKMAEEKARLDENERERTAEEIQDLYNNAPAGYHSLDENGVILQINDTELAWLGYTRDEVAGKKYFVDFLTPESQKVFKRAFPIFKQQGWIKDLALDMIRKDGTVMSALVNATAIKDADGNYVMSRETVFDVTELRRLQRQITESEMKYRNILEDMNDAYFELDTIGKFTLLNNTVCRMLLSSKEQLLGSSFRKYTPADELDMIRTTFDKIRETGEPSKGVVLQVIRTDASTFYIEITVSASRDRSGNIIGFRCVGRDVTERVEFQNKIAEAAMHDALTGLPNRSLLYDRFNIAHSQAERNKRSMAVMMLDLDYFKSVNDEFGHAAGDQLLKATAERLGRIVRKGDTVARLGGDEFVVLVPEIARTDDAVATARKILAAFGKPFMIDGHELAISASIGIAIYPEHGQNIDELLKCADEAMYYTKEHGRNNLKVSS